MKKIYYLVFASILAVPLSAIIPIPGTDVWFGQYLALLCMFCVGIALFLWDFNRFMSMFLLLCLYSTLIVSKQAPKAMLVLFQINLSCLAIYVISKFNSDLKERLLKVVIILFLLQSLWMILQRFDLDPIFTRFADDIRSSKRLDDTVGFSGSHNQIGIFFAITAPIVLRYCPYLLPLSFISLIWATTSTAFIGFIGAIAFYSFTKLKIMRMATKETKLISIFVLFVILMSAYLFFKSDRWSPGKYSERVELWSQSLWSVPMGRLMMMDEKDRLSYFKFNPFFGIGMGTFTRYSPVNQDIYIKSAHRYEHAHNDLVELTLEMGYSGLIAIIFMMIDIIIKFIKSIKTNLIVLSFSGLLAHFICSLGVYTVHTAVAGMLLILNLGIFYGEVEHGKR